MRTLAPAAEAAIAAGTVSIGLLVEMDLDGGQLYLNQSRLDLVINGATYVGTGGLGQVGEAANQSGDVPKLEFSLAAATPEKVALALGEPVQGRPVRLKLVLFSSAGAVLDVSLRYSGYLDVMGLEDGRQRAVLTVTSESGVRDLLRASNVRFTHVDQQLIAPGDMFYQFTNAQVERKIVFPSRHWYIAHPEKK